MNMKILLACVPLAASTGAIAGELVYGVTSDQTLVTWDSQTPGAILTGIAISGLAANESIRGIDFRPFNGKLYALGSFSNLYTINPSTGQATPVGAGSFSPGLSGSAFGFDFNPTIDRIRVVSDANQNLVLHPDLATSAAFTPVFYNAGDPNSGKDPNIVGSAYTNSFQGATSSQLFGIDTGLDILVKQANSLGTLDTVGPLGADITTLVGFDISGGSGLAFAASLEAGESKSMFWTIDLGTGLAWPIGEIGGGSLVSAIAVVPAPSAAMTLALGGLGLARRRR